MEIVQWDSLADPEPARMAIRRIFFEASGTKSFASEAARDTFFERWLGRYLVHDRKHVLVALNGEGEVLGYLVGCLDDPARTKRFGDIGYFAEFALLTARYPAHLHVNLDVQARGAGVGSLLVQAFCEQVAEAGLPGVHVVTGQGARNAGFYHRLGFFQRGTAVFNGHGIVFLGRDLA